MEQRGIAIEEIERTVNEGWEAEDTKPGTLGKVFVFPFYKQWEGGSSSRKSSAFIISSSMIRSRC